MNREQLEKLAAWMTEISGAMAYLQHLPNQNKWPVLNALREFKQTAGLIEETETE